MTLLQQLIDFARQSGPMPSYRDDTHELIFDGDIERYAFHFWEENGVWHFARSGSDNKRVIELSTPDHDIALRWLIRRVGSAARSRPPIRFHPLEIPVAGAFSPEDIAPGWSYEFIGERIGTLIAPDGRHLPIEMRGHPQLVPVNFIVLSHLMAYTPEQLLTSYMDPYGRPHLTPYLHEDSALVRMGNPLPNPIPPLETTQS